MEKLTNPGSKEARGLGCTCPVIDNEYGCGYLGGVKGENGKIIFVVNTDCPLHGRKTGKSEVLDEND